jgi:F0F1-type ATP synthase membrane subunit b/b'
MSQLDILKEQMEAMENKINMLKSSIDKAGTVVASLEKESKRIEEELNNARNKHESLIQNYNYLSDVHKETMNNYTQIENAATTLLDIIKSKCDNIG